MQKAAKQPTLHSYSVESSKYAQLSSMNHFLRYAAQSILNIP